MRWFDRPLPRREAIGRAIAVYPTPIECKWFLRDPIAAGLSEWENIADGRSYRSTSHVLYPFHVAGHASDRLVTVVVPEPEVTVAEMVHELAHVYDWSTRFEVQAEPVTAYAETNDYEAVAEFVTASLLEGYSQPEYMDQPEPAAHLALYGVVA